jgi:hypothetical protein
MSLSFPIMEMLIGFDSMAVEPKILKPKQTCVEK